MLRRNKKCTFHPCSIGLVFIIMHVRRINYSTEENDCYIFRRHNLFRMICIENMYFGCILKLKTIPPFFLLYEFIYVSALDLVEEK